MKKIYKALTFTILTFSLAPLALAASDGSGTLIEAANNISSLITTLTQAAYMLAFFAFFWFLAMYLLSKSDEDKSKNLKSLIIAIVVIFIMTSIWGIVRVLQNTVGAGNTTADQSFDIPGLKN